MPRCPCRSWFVAHLVEDIGERALRVCRSSGVDVEEIARPARRDEGARLDQGRAGPLRIAHGDQSRDESTVVGDAQLFTGFDPGKVARCMLPELSDPDRVHRPTVALLAIHTPGRGLIIRRRNRGRPGGFRSEWTKRVPVTCEAPSHERKTWQGFTIFFAYQSVVELSEGRWRLRQVRRSRTSNLIGEGRLA